MVRLYIILLRQLGSPRVFVLPYNAPSVVCVHIVGVVEQVGALHDIYVPINARIVFIDFIFPLVGGT